MRKVVGLPLCEVVVLVVQCLVLFELVGGVVDLALKVVDVDGEGDGGGNCDRKKHVHVGMLWHSWWR